MKQIHNMMKIGELPEALSLLTTALADDEFNDVDLITDNIIDCVVFGLRNWFFDRELTHVCLSFLQSCCLGAQSTLPHMIELGAFEALTTLITQEHDFNDEKSFSYQALKVACDFLLNPESVNMLGGKASTGTFFFGVYLEAQEPLRKNIATALQSLGERGIMAPPDSLRDIAARVDAGDVLIWDMLANQLQAMSNKGRGDLIPASVTMSVMKALPQATSESFTAIANCFRVLCNWPRHCLIIMLYNIEFKFSAIYEQVAESRTCGAWRDGLRALVQHNPNIILEKTVFSTCIIEIHYLCHALDNERQRSFQRLFPEPRVKTDPVITPRAHVIRAE